jgi:hypothetical protein
MLSSTVRKQAGHPARGECCGKSQAQRRAAAVRHQNAALDERRDDAAGLTFARTDEASGVGAWNFAAVEHGFEDGA